MYLRDDFHNFKVIKVVEEEVVTSFEIRRPYTGPRGSAQYNSKLTEAQVVEICQKRIAGATVKDLKAEYGVQSLSHILSGRSWKHVPRELPEKPQKPTRKKMCSKCGKEYDLNTDNFRWLYSQKTYCSQCRFCERTYALEYHKRRKNHGK